VLLKASNSYVKPLTPTLSPLLRRKERETTAKDSVEMHPTASGRLEQAAVFLKML
jgi:hypothetical protein